MTWTKNTTVTLPPTGSRDVTITTEGGVQMIRYHVVDSSGEGHRAAFTVAAVLAAHPEIDAPTLAATPRDLSSIRRHGMRLRRRLILSAAIFLCAAWTADETDGDTDYDACVRDCRASDHAGCEAVCSASEDPSCAVAQPGR